MEVMRWRSSDEMLGVEIPRCRDAEIRDAEMQRYNVYGGTGYCYGCWQHVQGMHCTVQLHRTDGECWVYMPILWLA